MLRHFKNMRPEVLFPLFAQTTSLKGVGPRVAESLGRAMGTRVKDVILTPPTGVIDRTARPGIAGARDGQTATFEVTVLRHLPPSAKGRPYRVIVGDDSGEMTLTYFHARGSFLQKLLPDNERRLISGKVEIFNAQAQMPHPDYVLAPENAAQMPGLEPLYPLSAGLSQKVARKTMLEALKSLPELPEWQNAALMEKQNWPRWAQAILMLHSPEYKEDMAISGRARSRLAYDELFAKQLALSIVRESNRRQSGRSLTTGKNYVQEVLAGAPFAPTGAQSRAYAEIAKDMSGPYRMARLLQGDVGAGKTFVAALAAAHASEGGAQTALMAPTEILARQHAETLKTLLAPAGLMVKAVTGRDKGKPREALATGMREGYIDVVVGTHALFQDKVEFKNLGLVIIDEQHRFGVHDRMKLSEKGQRPDLLVMTATPIPRTLALTAYGDLDISKLDEKPAGRQPIDTRILPLTRLDDMIDAMGRALKSGGRAYWVCPLVEDSEFIDLSSVEDRHRQLTAIFGNRVGLLHGRMKPDEKEAVALAFKNGEFDILVATTVIEVGVDAPDATIMVIEHAERFGLAQLHQLRGRVGRSDKKSSCFLLYQGPLSVNGKRRLEIMRETEDGFVIAEEDWDLRGSGDLLGSKQSGLPAYKMADLDKHKSLLEIASKDARALVQTDPKLETERGNAAKVCLYLFEQDYGVALMKLG